MVPAHEGLDAHQTARVDFHLRLVIEEHLVLFQRAAQKGFQTQALDALARHRRRIEAVAVAPARLGLVHGHVGIADQHVQVQRIVRIQADAHAAGDEQFMAGHRERLVEHGHQLFGHLRRAILAVYAFEQHDEFIAAQARQGVAFAQARRQLPGHLLQQFVAHMVAQGVVDVLEAVQVDEQHGQLLLVARGAQQRVLQAVVEQQAVRQRRQRVVVRHVVELFLRLLDQGDVAEHAHVMGGDGARVAHGADGQPLEVDFTVLALVPDFAAPEAAGDQLVPQGLVERRVVARRAVQR